MTQEVERRSSLVRGIALRFGAIVATLAVQAVLLFGGWLRPGRLAPDLW